MSQNSEMGNSREEKENRINDIERCVKIAFKLSELAKVEGLKNETRDEIYAAAHILNFAAEPVHANHMVGQDQDYVSRGLASGNPEEPNYNYVGTKRVIDYKHKPEVKARIDAFLKEHGFN